MIAVIIFMSGLAFGLILGIILGWSAAPASIWAGDEGRPEEPSGPDFVGMSGGQ
jgi:hypothetical protein